MRGSREDEEEEEEGMKGDEMDLTLSVSRPEKINQQPGQIRLGTVL
jgi:hypothetical protein